MAASNNGRPPAETFEASFKRLQEVVQRLSDGNLSLEEAMTAFEEGMDLAERCGRMLDDAELRVRQISERAARAGSSAIAEDLASQALASQAEPELVTFELEQYESTTLITETPDDPFVRPSSRPPASQPAVSNPKSKIQNPKSPEPLDPLFDEDD